MSSKEGSSWLWLIAGIGFGSLATYMCNQCINPSINRGPSRSSLTSTKANIPIPQKWQEINCVTVEGRKQIANLLINHDQTTEAYEYIYNLSCLVKPQYTQKEFDDDLALPLITAEQNLQDIALWTKIIPFVWNTLQIQSPRSHSNPVGSTDF